MSFQKWFTHCWLMNLYHRQNKHFKYRRFKVKGKRKLISMKENIQTAAKPDFT